MHDQKDLEITEIKHSFHEDEAVSSVLWGIIVLLSE